jgi:hypothetical protein
MIFIPLILSLIASVICQELLIEKPCAHQNKIYLQVHTKAGKHHGQTAMISAQMRFWAIRGIGGISEPVAHSTTAYDQLGASTVLRIQMPNQEEPSGDYLAHGYQIYVQAKTIEGAAKLYALASTPLFDKIPACSLWQRTWMQKCSMLSSCRKGNQQVVTDYDFGLVNNAVEMSPIKLMAATKKCPFQHETTFKHHAIEGFVAGRTVDEYQDPHGLNATQNGQPSGSSDLRIQKRPAGIIVWCLKQLLSKDGLKRIYREGILRSHPDKNREATSESFEIQVSTFHHRKFFHLFYRRGDSMRQRNFLRFMKMTRSQML